MSSVTYDWYVRSYTSDLIVTLGLFILFLINIITIDINIACSWSLIMNTLIVQFHFLVLLTGFNFSDYEHRFGRQGGRTSPDRRSILSWVDRTIVCGEVLFGYPLYILLIFYFV